MKVPQHVLSMVLMISVAIGQVRAQSTSLQDSTGLPGDSFSLQGALEMFKKAASPEDFERLINTRDNSVNNLDVNGDGDVDYVRVIDRVDNSAHAFVLQVPVSESESQDIAVIEVEKTGDASAMVQIVGDEDIYGEQTIVEPDGGGGDTEDVEDDGNGKGPSHRERVNESSTESRVVINVWTWPCVRFVYAPTYTVWVSPWRWRAYPAWWHPWRPLAWRVFHPFRQRYHAGFAVVRTHRMVHAHRIYAPVRTTSVTVRARHQGSVKHYRVTRTTTVKTRPGGTKVKTRTTTTKVRKNRR